VPFIDTSRLEAKEIRPGWTGRFVNTENLTLAYYTVPSGAWIHEHSHPNEEVWNIIDGDFEVTLDGDARVLGPGSVAVVPPDTPHSVTAVTDGRVIVVDYPVRHAIGGVDIG
jgi:quercetin dioxygenase-like cupin family protein